MIPFPSFDEQTVLWRWKSWPGNVRSSESCDCSAPVERGSGGTEHKNISKCKSNLMSSPRHNLIKSTHERTSAPYDIRMEVEVISFTDWRYTPLPGNPTYELQDKYLLCKLRFILDNRAIMFWRWVNKLINYREIKCLMQELHDSKFPLCDKSIVCIYLPVI